MSKSGSTEFSRCPLALHRFSGDRCASSCGSKLFVAAWSVREPFGNSMRSVSSDPTTSAHKGVRSTLFKRAPVYGTEVALRSAPGPHRGP